ncbi:MAG: peptidase MA family metallohydrolase, partial [Deltaproteobacteria bacterium]|nr:peptidase MA family metallohydrolase [Deltaproteobacteria bacterium]
AGYRIGILLEEAYIKVGSDLGFYPTDTITALLYSKERFRDITRSPAWSGGIYDGRIKLPAGGIYEKTDELEKVIFHEYTHAVAHRLSKGRAPVWLNEGIALHEEGRRSGEYAEYLRGLAETGEIDLKSLEGSFMGLSPEGAQVAYLLSLSATEYIIDEFGIFSVSRIFESLGNGMSLPEAISGALYLSYDDFERLWKESLGRR